MGLEELMGSLLMFEIELKEGSKEINKLVGLWAEIELPIDKDLLSNNFKRSIKRLNTQEKGDPQTRKIASSTFSPAKFGKTQRSLGPNIRNKPI